MVAISLYRGNLHRVPEIPRRWVMPRPSISLKAFRGLLRRRSKALSLQIWSGIGFHGSTSAPSALGNGNPPLPPPSLPPLPPPPPLQKKPDEKIEEEVVKPRAQNLSSPVMAEVRNSARNVSLEICKAEVVVAVEEVVKLVSPVEGKVKVEVEKVSGAVRGGDTEDLQIEKGKEEDQEKKDEDHDPNSEGKQKLGASNEKEERKREVEQKLEILNKKKHNLVQALKQILGAEEELKRRGSVQSTRPTLPLQVDVSFDSGSMTRVATPRTGSEANVGANTGGGGEADDVLNHDLQSRHIPRMSSISPSAESVLKRPYFQHNVASNPSRSSALVSGSPLRFAFSGNQAQASNLPPPVSTSGTNYAVSSSSPAASVGTSSFKDARSASS